MGSKIESGVIDPADVQHDIGRPLRDAMLDVVLAWARVDGAVSQFYATAHGLPEEENANWMSDKPTQLKLHEIVKLYMQSSPDLARAVRRLKKRYEKYSKTRDLIAHAYCRGTLISEPDRAVFMVYRRHPEQGGLIVDAVHISRFMEIASFGQRLASAVSDVDRMFRETKAAREKQLGAS